jgi:hypothetical protein
MKRAAAGDREARPPAGGFGLGNALFKDLAEGDPFTFKGSPDVIMIKTRNGYRTPEGRSFQTGARAAVFRVDALEATGRPNPETDDTLAPRIGSAP